MKYTLKNIEDDDFVADVLSELEDEICNGNNEEMRVIESVKSDSKTKGVGIFQLVVEAANHFEVSASLLENVMGGMIAAGLCKMLKTIIGRLKRTQEYAPAKKIEIIQEDSQGKKTTIKITIQEIEEKDVR